MAWLLDDKNEQDYRDACKDAVTNEDAYGIFRRSDPFRLIVENSPLKSGLEYYECIQGQYPWLIPYMPTFQTSDKIGNPITSIIGGHEISPTTMRYVKTFGDLYKFFGSLDGMNIVEIGGGYGGLCKIIHDVCKPFAYMIYDLPIVSALQNKFLSEFGINLQPNSARPDLVIAMYSWSELTEDVQEQYLKAVISKAKNCYIMLNYDMEFSYSLLTRTFPLENIQSFNIFYDDNNTEYAPYNRFIIIKNL